MLLVLILDIQYMGPNKGKTHGYLGFSYFAYNLIEGCYSVLTDKCWLLSQQLYDAEKSKHCVFLQWNGTPCLLK